MFYTEIKVTFLVFLTLLFKTHAEEIFLPSYITPCDNGPQLGQCIKEQMQLSIPHFVGGIPELGIQSLDPLHIDDIFIDGNGLKLSFTDVVLNGIFNSTVTLFTINLETDGSFRLKFMNNITLLSNYLMDGKVLIVPVKGKGESNIYMHNSEMDVSAKITTFKDNKGEHFKLVSSSFIHSMEKVIFKFSNLFDGNKQLSEITHKFANENWKQIMDDVAPPIAKQIVKTVIKQINKFFSCFKTTQLIKGYNS